MTRAQATELRALAERARDADAAFQAVKPAEGGEWSGEAMAAVYAVRVATRRLGQAHALVLSLVDELNALPCPTCNGACTLDGLLPCGGCRGLGTRGGAHD